MKIKGLKRLALVAVAAGLLFALSAGPAFAGTASGSFGDGLKWKLDTDTGVMTISGSGAIPNYKYNTYKETWGRPWEKYTKKIKSVVIREGITRVGNCAFIQDPYPDDYKKYRTITSVTLPGSLRTIGEGAFEYCPIKTIDIPEGVTTIGQEAFNSTSLTSVWFPDSLKSLGGFSFQFCDQLAEIRLSPNTKTISEYAFNQCKTLVGVEIPEGVTRIGESAFGRCQSLMNVQLPSTLKRIDASAFEECEQIGQVELPQGLAYIGNLAFVYTNLSAETSIPDSVEYIGREAFWGTPLGGEVLVENAEHPGMTIVGTTLVNYCGADSTVRVPEGITAISCNAFGGVGIDEQSGSWRWDQPFDQTTHKVILPAPVKYIGTEAFYRATELRQINLENVTVIESRAFEECERLKEVSLSGSIESVGAYAFMGCKRMTALDTGGLTKIPVRAFEDCKSIESVTYGGAMDAIGKGAFDGCQKLPKAPKLSDKVTKIPENAFRDCRAITKISIPESVTAIEDHAFYGCKGMKSITIPPSVKSFGDEVFKSSAVSKIRGVKNSAAQKYAKQQNLSFAEAGTVKQPMKVSVSAASVKYSAVKAAAVKLMPITIKSAQGTVRCKVLSGSAASKKALKLNSKTGAITVKKLTKKGTYSLKVRVSADGTLKYKYGQKTVTVSVRVK